MKDFQKGVKGILDAKRLSDDLSHKYSKNSSGNMDDEELYRKFWQKPESSF